ncbi:MAG: DUF1292 domain-containing protein [Oscillospiraceae bacterium]|nr:DUF1292 domain-containing protein [Oscillospiraceae bacterium]
MSEEFGSDFITISDDDGNEFELEYLETIEVDGALYMAFLPADMDEEDENYGMVILKKVTQGDEEILTTIDDENELATIFERFVEVFMDTDEEE